MTMILRWWSTVTVLVSAILFYRKGHFVLVSVSILFGLFELVSRRAMQRIVDREARSLQALRRHQRRKGELTPEMEELLDSTEPRLAREAIPDRLALMNMAASFLGLALLVLAIILNF